MLWNQVKILRDNASGKSCNLRDVVNIRSSSANDFDGFIIANVSVNRLLGVLHLCGNNRGEIALKIEGDDLFLVGNRPG